MRYNLLQLFLNFNVYEPSVRFLFCSSNAANATYMAVVAASSIATKFHEDFEICVFKK